MSRGKIWKSTVFTLAFKKALEFYGLKQKDIAEKIEMPTGRVSEYATGKTDPTIENVNKIATAFDLSISEFFALADETTHDKSLPPEKPGEAPNPPVAAVPPPAPGPSRDDELEALRQKLETARDRNDKLTDEMLAANAIRNEVTAELLGKDKIIANTTEALRIKDIEVAEKREALMAKDKIIGQLVNLLKAEGLEHVIPPALTSQMEKSQAEAESQTR